MADFYDGDVYEDEYESEDAHGGLGADEAVESVSFWFESCRATQTRRRCCARWSRSLALALLASTLAIPTSYTPPPPNKLNL